MSINIVLIGMPGSGKTNIGTLISEKLNRNFIDIDRYIEQEENKTIKEIYDISENYFRDTESKYAAQIGKLDSYVISTGGGIVKRKENILNLKKNSVIIFINRPIENIIKDIDITRSLLKGGEEKLYKLYNERIHLYKEYCDIEIKNDKDINEVADELIKKIESWQKH